MSSFSINRNAVRLHETGIAKPTRLLVVSDAHLSMDDERGLPNQENSKRMAAAYPQAFANFTQMLSERQPDRYDYLLMLGDMVSFPSAKGVETIIEMANKMGLPFAYTAGNHDWHFEGLPGTEIDLRREWTAKRLAPLYQGHNPLCYNIELNGLNLVMMDTSACVMLPEQLDFWREQVKKGLPTIVFGHVPYWVPGRDSGFSVGHPNWNASTDVNWKVERRPRWPESGHDQLTMDFHKEVFAAPNLLGIVAGHIHEQSVDFYRGKFQVVVQYGVTGGFLEMTID
ncbi:MAG: metallophosphoesterase [Lentisphaeria bacterium]|nr:metallophosphoesterase [Lentisphaeria bacterium]